MQQPDMRVGAVDHLAFHLEQQTQHAVRCRMLRPEIDGVVAHLDLGHRVLWLESSAPAGPAAQVEAFSSPGSSPPPPSHGERKSQLRKSWRSSTGS